MLRGLVGPRLRTVVGIRCCQGSCCRPPYPEPCCHPPRQPKPCCCQQCPPESYYCYPCRPYPPCCPTSPPEPWCYQPCPPKSCYAPSQSESCYCSQCPPCPAKPCYCPQPCPPCPPIPCPQPEPIAPNPCCPIYPFGNHKIFKYTFLLVCLPTIAFQMYRLIKIYYGQDHLHKCPCRHLEYMRRRTKKYPWGTGIETFFHNPNVNSLPDECTEQMQPQDCDDYYKIATSS